MEYIQHVSMLNAKQVKCSVYNLVRQNYIQLRELKKSGSSPMTKTFHLFYIDLPVVVETLVEHCCQSLYNIIRKRIHVCTSNKRMIEKQSRVQTLSATLSNMKEFGATEQLLADVISDIYYQKFSRFKISIKKCLKLLSLVSADRRHVDAIRERTA